MEHRLFNALLAAVLVTVLAAPFAVDFQEAEAARWPLVLLMPQCFVLRQTGHICPACGLTRSILALYKGHWELSRTYHPAGFVVLAALLFELLLRMLPAFAKSSRWLWADIGQVIVVGLLVRFSLSW